MATDGDDDDNDAGSHDSIASDGDVNSAVSRNDDGDAEHDDYEVDVCAG